MTTFGYTDILNHLELLEKELQVYKLTGNENAWPAKIMKESHRIISELVKELLDD